MAISEINNNYSAILTTPFLGRRITLTPNNIEPEKEATPDNEVTFSRNNFYDNKAPNSLIENIINTENGPKSCKEIVEKSISRGFSPLEAVHVYKAQKAYEFSLIKENSNLELYSAETEA